MSHGCVCATIEVPPPVRHYLCAAASASLHDVSLPPLCQRRTLRTKAAKTCLGGHQQLSAVVHSNVWCAYFNQIGTKRNQCTHTAPTAPSTVEHKNKTLATCHSWRKAVVGRKTRTSRGNIPEYKVNCAEVVSPHRTDGDLYHDLAHLDRIIAVWIYCARSVPYKIPPGQHVHRSCAIQILTRKAIARWCRSSLS